ncbi:MAG: aminotransferase class I/II-fold pyridoxal phosphate-dependent enzyme, partial [Bdellovibrionota bacterium]
MREFKEIWSWIAAGGSPHDCLPVSSLPNPNFISEDKKFVSFSSNNYLSLADSPRLVAAAKLGLEKFGVANCESRLLGGDLDIYRELESELARMKKKKSALLFATGYLTNLGVLSSLVKAPQLARMYGFKPSRRSKSAYFSDEFNHISIREGIRASEADRFTYRHVDLNHLEMGLKKSDATSKIIVTDGVFSQDGDIAPLPQLLELAELYDATVYVDDAHGTGVLGKNGGGISEHFNCYSPRLIHMGTLSKAYGAIGGFIAAEESICEVLRLTSSAYGFTSTLPPDQAYAVLEAIRMVKTEPERRVRLWANQVYFVEKMQALGYEFTSTETPILPIIIGDERTAQVMTEKLHEFGYHVDAVKFPAVARGQARLRFIMNANHSARQLERLVEIMAELRQRFLSVTGEAKGKSAA